MSIERQLATVQRIKEILPHPNADKMELARVLGWIVCVKKGEFKAGDLCVYCEVDSILPQKPEFEFLRPRNFRIKTIRLRNVISQGIVFPLSIINAKMDKTFEGQDVSAELDVKKYEPPVPQGSNALGPMPGFLFKTDQTRFQSVPGILQRHVGCIFNITEKLDGMSMTAYLRNGRFGVCGRTMELKEEENAYWVAAKKNQLKERLEQFGGNVAVQGECIGKGVQGNWLEMTEVDFRVFDLFDIDQGKYFDHIDHASLINNRLGLKTVPYLGTFEFKPDTTVDQVVALGTCKSMIAPNKWAEGVVLNPMHEATDVELGRLSFKVLNPEYDLAQA